MSAFPTSVGPLDEDRMEGLLPGDEDEVADFDPTQNDEAAMDPDDFEEGSGGYTDADGDEDDDEYDDTTYNTHQQPIHPYPHLREISSLASWTLSSHKPGCGISSLRHPSPSRFWQSDGPQPHILSLHFFKRVSVAHARLRVDFRDDESYTPTKLQVWAGTGHHDLQIVTETCLEKPRGWLNVDLSRAGGPSEFESGDEVAGSESEEEEDDDEDEEAVRNESLDEDAAAKKNETEIEAAKRRKKRRQKLKKIGRGPTLRCFLLQIRILENHQNGKDTHLRGFQVFAKDEEAAATRRMRRRAAGFSSGVSLKAAVEAVNPEIHRNPVNKGHKAHWSVETVDKAAYFRRHQQGIEKERAPAGRHDVPTSDMHQASRSFREVVGSDSGAQTESGTHWSAQPPSSKASSGGRVNTGPSKPTRHDSPQHQRSRLEPGVMDLDLDLDDLKHGRVLPDASPAQVAEIEKTVRGIRDSDWMREGEVR